MNEYEIQCTRKYEGSYTAEEVELNNRLYDACTQKVLDCDLIEKLLNQGADPLGATATSGWGLLEHIYGEVICDLVDSGNKNLSCITELFLKHGMDIEHPRVPYDDDNSLHPMWQFAFLTGDDAMCALNMLLDNGLSADAVGEMWGHMLFDLFNCACGDPCSDPFWNNTCTWTMKAIMFCASYDHVLLNDEDLYRFIDCSYNSYDLHKFRNWNDFGYEFDTTHCTNEPELYRSIVKIFERSSSKEVWKIGVGLNEGEF